MGDQLVGGHRHVSPLAPRARRRVAITFCWSWRHSIPSRAVMSIGPPMRQVDLLRRADECRAPRAADRRRGGTAPSHWRCSVQHQLRRAGELDHGALVGHREALGVQGAERAFGVRRLGAGGGAVLQVDEALAVVSVVPSSR